MQTKECEKQLEIGSKKKINFTFDSNGEILYKRAPNMGSLPPQREEVLVIKSVTDAEILTPEPVKEKPKTQSAIRKVTETMGDVLTSLTTVTDKNDMNAQLI